MKQILQYFNPKKDNTVGVEHPNGTKIIIHADKQGVHIECQHKPGTEVKFTSSIFTPKSLMKKPSGVRKASEDEIDRAPSEIKKMIDRGGFSPRETAVIKKLIENFNEEVSALSLIATSEDRVSLANLPAIIGCIGKKIRRFPIKIECGEGYYRMYLSEYCNRI